MATIFEQLDQQLRRKHNRKEKPPHLNREKLAQLERIRQRALQQMELRPGTKIIPQESVPQILPNIPIVLTPEFQDFAQQLRIWQDRESAGIMHIDFQAQGTSILRPMIYLVNAFQTDVGSEDSVILPGDEGASFRPGEIEWHTHPRSLPEYGLNLDWQDLYNIVAGPCFVDPHHDVPDNDFRWISAIMAHYPDWHQTTGLQLYLYELAKYDGRNPLSGLSKLGPMVRVSSNR